MEKKFGFSQPQYARHYRELFADYETILVPFLSNHLHQFLAYLGACVSWLTYSSTIMDGSNEDRARSVLRYRVMAFLLIQGARLVVEKRGWETLKICPQFKSVYSHALLNHMADQLETIGKYCISFMLCLIYNTQMDRSSSGSLIRGVGREIDPRHAASQHQSPSRTRSISNA